MRSALFSLLITLAASVLVMVGGERMARREVETLTPLDRDRLFDFDHALRAELGRLSDLYQSHLRSLAETLAAPLARDGNPSQMLEEISGVLRVQVMEPGKKAQFHDASLRSSRLPEIHLGDDRRAFNPQQAVALGKDFQPASLRPDGIWRETPQEGVMLCLLPSESGGFVALFIDSHAIQAKTREHLSQWLESPISPLREAGERVQITDPSGRPLYTTGPDRFGPAAAILPIRTSLGTWQIEAWDGIAVRKDHNHKILVTTGGLAMLLLVGGILLFLHQQRAMRMASERVSFVNRVSHELGAPLTNIMLNLDLARDHLADLPPAARRRLDLVNEEMQRLSRLVANVLTFSRQERDAIQLSPVPCIPADVIHSVIETFRPALDRRGIMMEHDIQAAQTAELDPDALTQIIGNLISNVEKYAFSGGWMCIRAMCHDEWLVVDVSDRGPGIPRNQRKRIFSPFARVHQAVNEGSSGTGLGLAIAK